MAAERRDGEPSREFRLEGVGLVVVGGVLVAALSGAFFFGRWVERRALPTAGTAAAELDPLAGVVQREPDANAEADLTFFDRVEGSGLEAEPDREMPVADPAPARTAPEPARSLAAPAAKPPASDGDFFVQVFAGRDRRAAESVVEKLRRDGWAVRLFSEREGQGSLFKVRVGGYRTQAEAREIAAGLQKTGHAGAWVTRVQ